MTTVAEDRQQKIAALAGMADELVRASATLKTVVELLISKVEVDQPTLEGYLDSLAAAENALAAAQSTLESLFPGLAKPKPAEPSHKTPEHETKKAEDTKKDK